MTEIVKMSSKGQIVVPKSLRSKLAVDSTSSFAVFGNDDTIILKKIRVPQAKDVFAQLNVWGVAQAKKKGWKEQDVTKKIHRGRGVRTE